MPIPQVNCRLTPPQGNEVHVWTVNLGDQFARGTWCEAVLSTEERDRANRFVFDPDREDFIRSHAALRVLLEAYGVAVADQVHFLASAQGKPALDPEHHRSSLQFNLAHARGIAMLAFVNDRSVGIDVELLRVVDDADGIVERYFSHQERAEYSAIDPSLRPRCFLNAWTRKEAYLKALGTGLGGELSSFAVTLNTGNPARIVHVQGCTDEPQEWTLQDLSVDERIVAVAVRATNLRIVQHDWQSWFSQSAPYSD